MLQLLILAVIFITVKFINAFCDKFIEKLAEKVVDELFKFWE